MSGYAFFGLIFPPITDEGMLKLPTAIGDLPETPLNSVPIPSCI